MANLTWRSLYNSQTDDGETSALGWGWFGPSWASDFDWVSERTTAPALSWRTEVEPAPHFGGNLGAPKPSQGSNASPSASSPPKRTSQDPALAAISPSIRRSQNPWNTAYSGPLAMSFTETIQQLAQDDCALYATNGRPVA